VHGRLNIARVIGFHQLFFMPHLLKKAFERRDFWETGFKNRVSAFTKSSFFFYFFWDFKMKRAFEEG